MCCIQYWSQFADIDFNDPPYPMTLRPLILSFALLLGGCDIPGMGPDPRIAQREAEANAIGSACRHGLRSIEDCYNLNEGISKAAIFAGWKEMDQYMRENKIEGVRATVNQAAPEEEVLDDKTSKVADPQRLAASNPRSPEKLAPKTAEKTISR